MEPPRAADPAGGAAGLSRSPLAPTEKQPVLGNQSQLRPPRQQLPSFEGPTAARMTIRSSERVIARGLGTIGYPGRYESKGNPIASFMSFVPGTVSALNPLGASGWGVNL